MESKFRNYIRLDLCDRIKETRHYDEDNNLKIDVVSENGDYCCALVTDLDTKKEHLLEVNNNEEDLLFNGVATLTEDDNINYGYGFECNFIKEKTTVNKFNSDYFNLNFYSNRAIFSCYVSSSKYDKESNVVIFDDISVKIGNIEMRIHPKLDYSLFDGKDYNYTGIGYDFENVLRVNTTLKTGVEYPVEVRRIKHKVVKDRLNYFSMRGGSEWYGYGDNRRLVSSFSFTYDKDFTEIFKDVIISNNEGLSVSNSGSKYDTHPTILKATDEKYYFLNMEYTENRDSNWRDIDPNAFFVIKYHRNNIAYMGKLSDFKGKILIEDNYKGNRFETYAEDKLFFYLYKSSNAEKCNLLYKGQLSDEPLITNDGRTISRIEYDGKFYKFSISGSALYKDAQIVIKANDRYLIGNFSKHTEKEGNIYYFFETTDKFYESIRNSEVEIYLYSIDNMTRRITYFEINSENMIKYNENVEAEFKDIIEEVTYYGGYGSVTVKSDGSIVDNTLFKNGIIEYSYGSGGYFLDIRIKYKKEVTINKKYQFECNYGIYGGYRYKYLGRDFILFEIYCENYNGAGEIYKYPFEITLFKV